jgi:hypothetical protein
LQLIKGQTQADIVGSKEAAAEIGEILAWLGSALRSNPHSAKVGLCSVKIDPRPSEARDKDSVRCCHMRFDVDKWYTVAGNGSCWINLFRNPVIAAGFPILARTEAQSACGLELSLDMMAVLTQAKYVTKFDERIVMKGFSTMLVPTERNGDTIFWHMLYNEDGNRISYRDDRIANEASDLHMELEYADAERSRHVLGWSSKVEISAGESKMFLWNLLPNFCSIRRAPRTLAAHFPETTILATNDGYRCCERELSDTSLGIYWSSTGCGSRKAIPIRRESGYRRCQLQRRHQRCPATSEA